jgi:hypothetical protein
MIMVGDIIRVDKSRLVEKYVRHHSETSEGNQKTKYTSLMLFPLKTTNPEQISIIYLDSYNYLVKKKKKAN